MCVSIDSDSSHLILLAYRSNRSSQPFHGFQDRRNPEYWPPSFATSLGNQTASEAPFLLCVAKAVNAYKTTSRDRPSWLRDDGGTCRGRVLPQRIW